MDLKEPLKFPSLKGKVSDAEWQARIDLAACYRLVDHYGMSDMIYNHISVRVPGPDDHFLINPFGMTYGEMCASCFIKLDLDGNVIHQPDIEYGHNPAGYVIHSAIHGARPEIDCVIHTHSLAGMAVSALKCGLLPLNQTAMRFETVAYHDYEGVALNLEERERLIADLGTLDVMILRNHGLLTCGRTVAEAFNNIYRLERSCRAQLMAMACNTELILPSEEVFRVTAHQYKPNVRRRFGVLEWPAMIRMLNRQDKSYMD
jgi:ribulose-5-phosphate 4-epimerase/fuculose-1-phosphate aldolase